jgi:acyl carrier protein
MIEAQVCAILTDMLREILNDPGLELQADRLESDLAKFDSGNKVMLILAIEERFAIRLRSREIDALRTFGDWVTLVHMHVARATGGRQRD